MSDTKPCPFCGEAIQAVALKCKHCGEWLSGQRPVPARPPRPTAFRPHLRVVVAAYLGSLPGLWWLTAVSIGNLGSVTDARASAVSLGLSPLLGLLVAAVPGAAFTYALPPLARRGHSPWTLAAGSALLHVVLLRLLWEPAWFGLSGYLARQAPLLYPLVLACISVPAMGASLWASFRWAGAAPARAPARDGRTANRPTTR